MNEDYLWNKTGEDAEIAELENALSVFRYEPTAAPILPVKAAVTEGRAGWKLSFAFAAAVCVVAAVYISFWISEQQNELMFETGQSIAENRVGEKILPHEKPLEEAFPEKAEIVDRKEEENRRSQPVRVAKTAVNRTRKTPTAAHAVASKKPIPALTSEEKHAYQQLMLALSITGSQLKIVKESINGGNERENNSYTNKR